MDWLYNLDREVFRAVHVHFRQDWLDPWFLVLSQTGLGQVQYSLLLVACFPQQRRWIVPAMFGLVLLIWSLNPAWRELLVSQLLVNGFGLAMLGMVALPLVRYDLRKYALPTLISGVVAGIVRLGVMRLVGRPRPSNLDFADPLDPIFANTSFPSGHATTSFAIAFMLVLLTKGTDRSWIGWLALTWAILVGFSRIYLGVHWPSDIVGGAGLGLAVAAGVWLAMKDKEPEKGESTPLVPNS